jgi:hypothetical protein
MGIFKYSSWCFPQPSTEPDRINCCGAVPIKPLRPDLAIYSQDEQLAAGAAATWINPDITPDIRAEFSKILVTVRNLSPQISALNALVIVGLAFPKIGRTPQPNGTQQISLPPGGQTQLTFPVTVPLDQISEPGPYDTPAVLVQLVHPDDDVLINNAGEFRRIKIVLDPSPGEYLAFSVTVANQTQTSQRVSFTALGVVPNNYTVVFVPAVQDIPAHREASVQAQVRPPPPDDADMQITIACRDPGGGLLAAATYVLVR